MTLPPEIQFVVRLDQHVQLRSSANENATPQQNPFYTLLIGLFEEEIIKLGNSLVADRVIPPKTFIPVALTLNHGESCIQV